MGRSKRGHYQVAVLMTMVVDAESEEEAQDMAFLAMDEPDSMIPGVMSVEAEVIGLMRKAVS